MITKEFFENMSIKAIWNHIKKQNNKIEELKRINNGLQEIINENRSEIKFCNYLQLEDADFRRGK